MYASMKCRNSSLLRANLSAKQRGAVLILALLIVAMVAGLGIKFAGDYQLGLARAEGRWNGAQARVYSFSAEGVALTMLSKDATPGYDAKGEAWDINTSIPLEDGSGTLLITVTDATSQMDLNTLVPAQSNPLKPVLDPNMSPLNPERYTQEQRRFIRLLQLFPDLVHSPDQAAGILEAIVDWVDGDDNPSGTYGAETSYYLGLPDPYRPANVVFRSVEELQMVRGITPELMRALRPYITVLKTSQGGPIGMNVNTMEPLLYRCINLSNDLKPLDEAQAAKLIPPDGAPYKDMSEFDQALAKAMGVTTGVDKDGLSTLTNLFWVKTQADIGDQRRAGRSLLERGTPLFKVIKREEIY